MYSQIWIPCNKIVLIHQMNLAVHKIAAKVRVFQKKVKLQDQGHEVKSYGSMWKVL